MSSLVVGLDVQYRDSHMSDRNSGQRLHYCITDDVVLWFRFFGAASLMYYEVRSGCLLLGVEPHLRCCTSGIDAACSVSLCGRYMNLYGVERGLVATYHWWSKICSERGRTLQSLVQSFEWPVV
jgi:hypothetical protein